MGVRIRAHERARTQMRFSAILVLFFFLKWKKEKKRKEKYGDHDHTAAAAELATTANGNRARAVRNLTLTNRHTIQRFSLGKTFMYRFVCFWPFSIRQPSYFQRDIYYCLSFVSFFLRIFHLCDLYSDSWALFVRFVQCLKTPAI